MKSFFKYLLFTFFVSFSIGTTAQESNSEFARSAISVGVLVQDMDKSLEFYTKVVGMIQVREFSIDTEKAGRMGLTNGKPFSVKVLKLENVVNATEWKLVSFGKKTKLAKQKFIDDDNGIRYATIFVKSMQPLLERIKKYGVKTYGQSPTMLDETRQFVLLKDPDGNFIEFIGPK
ncbi:MAG: hypothetical protein AUK44_03745 [Porphyromonadaceae bacterium CG2_30_38_12]|nr:MAG: hypothetical protein AUK44_03745 [Porphyromonadaceae bacterium CG2_30_38_12]